MNKRIVLAPKLRFPEYCDTGEWKICLLGELAKRISIRNKNASIKRVLTNSATEGVVDQNDYFNKGIANLNNLENYFMIDEGDYVYNPRVSANAPVGPISKNRVGKGIMSPLYMVFRFDNCKNDFYEQYFKTNLWHRYLKSVSNTGARHDRMSISQDSFMKMPLPCHLEEEQQKIADCLFSLDDLISAEKLKLDNLKAHKKGLVQKLFPAFGKALPEWRFPEFRDSGEWVEKNLGEIGDVVASGDLDKALFSLTQSDKYPFPVYSNSIDGIYGYYANALYPKQSVTITARGTLGVAFVRDHNFMGIGRLIVVSNLVEHANFVKECWNHMARIPKEITSIPQLTAIAAKKVILPIPKMKEQQKISDCLSSIDDIITGQIQKIDALTTYKKGLMQGLFPSMMEVADEQ